MATDVSWMLELNVKPGSDKEFRALLNEMVTATRTNEPRTLNYEWSLSDDGGVCHLYERYADSAAAMTHLATFGAKFANRFLELLKPVRFTVYGAPSQELKEALGAFKAVYMKPVGGFSR